MTEEEVLRAEDMVAGYTDLNVLKGVSIKVHKDEMVAIIGPNGAGKSTLLKAIFGILKPKSGTVELKDMDITGGEPEQLVRKGISYVPQLENIFPTLTVKENLEMGGILLDDTSERIEEIYNLFPILEEKKAARAKTLSGGQQKAVAIGRGLMLNPDVLLLDEPSAGLAPNLTEEVWSKIERTNESGTAIVIVEQNARKALKMCDYGYVLDDGQNKYEGEGSELLDDEDVIDLYLGG